MTAKTSFSCGELLDVTVVQSLHTRPQKSIEKSSVIELKADAVQKADTAGLQLLIAVAQSVNKSDGKIIWKKPSQVLLDAVKLLGFKKELGLS